MNIHVYTGDTRTLNFAVTDSNNAAVDITAATIAFKVVQRKTRAVLISLSVGSGVTVTDATGGLFAVSISAANSAAYPGSHFYEATVTISGSTSLVASGVIEFVKSPAD